MAINVNVANAQAGQLSSYANQLRNAITIRAISKNTYIKRAVNRLFFYFKRAKLLDFSSYISVNGKRGGILNDKRKEKIDSRRNANRPRISLLYYRKSVLYAVDVLCERDKR